MTGKTVTEARRLIDGASFGPEELKEGHRSSLRGCVGRDRWQLRRWRSGHREGPPTARQGDAVRGNNRGKP